MRCTMEFHGDEDELEAYHNAMTEFYMESKVYDWEHGDIEHE